MNENEDWKRVILYLRLSDEDKDKMTKEEISESIKNQELMLTAYANDNKWRVVGVFSDEDWSGGDSSRPEFNKMIELCKNRQTDIVLCKTQARFARDSELIEKYIHNLFHEWNIRFHTVVDRIDNTKRETKKTSQILGLTDEWYLEDTSLNIRETFKSKRKEGQYTGSFVAYGYMKDPENKNHLVIDPVAGNVVRRIYNDFLKGDGISTIKKKLNKENILSPFEYKLMNGSNLKNPQLNVYSRYDCIEKAGTYKCDFSYINMSGEVLKNFVIYNYVTKDNKIFDNKCIIQISKLDNEKCKIYYSIKKINTYLDFNKDDWIEFNIGDILPNNVTCIATKIDELDRTHNIMYQLQIILPNNVEHEKYFIKSFSNNSLISKDDININIRKKFEWCNQTIKKILTDEVYIGNLLQFKTTTVSYKNHTRIYNDEKDWIRKNHTHEPIIDEKDWYIVQQKTHRRMRGGKNGCLHPFQNIVYCTTCGNTFGKAGGTIVEGSSYLSCKDRRKGWANCTNRKYIKISELENFVLNKINLLIDKYYNEKELINIKNKDMEKSVFVEKIEGLQIELEKLENEIKNKSTYLQKIYEDRLTGILDNQDFLMLKEKYKDDCDKAKERIENIRKEIDFTYKKKESIKNKKDIFKKYTHIDKLNTEIVNEFIDKIYIGEYDKIKNSRDIKIIWNFVI